MKFGVVVGHFELPQFLRLNLAAIRHHCGDDFPILVSDDCSRGCVPMECDTPFSEAVKIANDYGATVWPNLRRYAHHRGDLMAFVKALLWGDHLGLDVVFKLSVRLIIDRTLWAQRWGKKLMESEAVTLGRWWYGGRQLIRTEAMGLKVVPWQAAIPALRGHAEKFDVHEPAEPILARVQLMLGEPMLDWETIGFNKWGSVKTTVFYCADSRERYRELANRLGVPFDVNDCWNPGWASGYRA